MGEGCCADKERSAVPMEIKGSLPPALSYLRSQRVKAALAKVGPLHRNLSTPVDFSSPFTGLVGKICRECALLEV